MSGWLFSFVLWTKDQYYFTVTKMKKACHGVFTEAENYNGARRETFLQGPPEPSRGAVLHGKSSFHAGLNARKSVSATNKNSGRSQTSFLGGPHFCSQCSAAFSCLGTLRRHHESVHVKHSNFMCKICSRKFTRKETLRDHMNIHANIKPYQCHKCNVLFSHKTNFRKHLRDGICDVQRITQLQRGRLQMRQLDSFL